MLRVALPMMLVLAGPLAAGVEHQLPFPLRDMLPRICRAAGGERAWAGLRDISTLLMRRQLRPDGSIRASEELRIHLQTHPRVGLLLRRMAGDYEIQQGWHRGEAWMADGGLRVHDKGRLQDARREVLESLFLERLPFNLADEMTGPLVYEGDFEFEGRRVHRLRFASGEFPGGDVRLLVDTASYDLKAIGWFAPEGSYTEVVFGRRIEEHGVRVPWLREFRTGGRAVRRDEVKQLEVNQWFSPDIFKIEAWLRR